MIYQVGLDHPDAAVVDIPVEIYLRGKHDPISSVVTFCFDRGQISRDNPVESFMSRVAYDIKDSLGQEVAVVCLSNGEHSQMILRRSEIQAINLSAPADDIWEAIV